MEERKWLTSTNQYYQTRLVKGGGGVTGMANEPIIPFCESVTEQRGPPKANECWNIIIICAWVLVASRVANFDTAACKNFS